MLQRTRSWHRPSTTFALALAVTAVVCVVAMVVDQRTVLGAPVWDKLFKFAVSGALYFLTWGWLVSLLPRFQRTARIATDVVIVLFAGEYVVMVGQAARARPSHFNNATPLDKTLFTAMGGMVAGIWVATLVLTVLLMFTRLEDRATHWAVRTGAVISLTGIGLGALMLGPTAQQRARLKATGASDLIGAHSVGVPDGGAGLPILGWSTTGGDLRIPHFTGMHALQLLPLLALGLGLLATRFPRLRDSAVRVRLVWVGSLGYAGLVALVTWQAVRGEPLVHPSAATLTAAGTLVATVALGAAASVRRPQRVLVR
ncbi:hypothetical protein [Amycolatopsis sp. FDAARGOS 1241]|uniref:hypothetical protein n=1 Tax=Amycolatopsis sp. FDAARGOS 1241 TaxID=2778070 RepID=UPI001951ED00|nr:hypothetical protein [Amycolatopsis sp. FDAARGOS 1241]QRP45195.1 hypothetical protein I6J71_39470 [Amycolatopsis sp. FDAARGOS 1241]